MTATEQLRQQREQALAELAQYKAAMEREKSPEWQQYVSEHANYCERLSTNFAGKDKEMLMACSILINEHWQCFTHKANFVPSELRIKELEGELGLTRDVAAKHALDCGDARKLLKACLETGALRTDATRQIYLDVCKCLGREP